MNLTEMLMRVIEKRAGVNLVRPSKGVLPQLGEEANDLIHNLHLKAKATVPSNSPVNARPAGGAAGAVDANNFQKLPWYRQLLEKAKTKVIDTNQYFAANPAVREYAGISDELLGLGMNKLQSARPGCLAEFLIRDAAAAAHLKMAAVNWDPNKPSPLAQHLANKPAPTPASTAAYSKPIIDKANAEALAKQQAQNASRQAASANSARLGNGSLSSAVEFYTGKPAGEHLSNLAQKAKSVGHFVGAKGLSIFHDLASSPLAAGMAGLVPLAAGHKMSSVLLSDFAQQLSLDVQERMARKLAMSDMERLNQQYNQGLPGLQKGVPKKPLVPAMQAMTENAVLQDQAARMTRPMISPKAVTGTRSAMPAAFKALSAVRK